MEYFFQSIRTTSYWKYALFTKDAFKTLMAVMGGIWTLIEIGDYFKLIKHDKVPTYAFFIFLAISVIVVIATRRPINRIRYKIPSRDLNIEVRIGNVFKVKGHKIVSTNTTFDTDIASGIISPNSVQGQFTSSYYANNIQKLNDELDRALQGITFEIISKQSGKVKKYPIGTTVPFNEGPERFYWFAMADMNFYNTTETNVNTVMLALNQLWEFISTHGELEDLVLPLIGTGRGRLTVSRKKLIADIAQSFVKASENRIFSNKLVIVIHPKDVANFGINLFEVRDLLGNYIN